MPEIRHKPAEEAGLRWITSPRRAYHPATRVGEVTAERRDRLNFRRGQARIANGPEHAKDSKLKWHASDSK